MPDYLEDASEKPVKKIVAAGTWVLGSTGFFLPEVLVREDGTNEVVCLHVSCVFFMQTNDFCWKCRCVRVSLFPSFYLCVFFEALNILCDKKSSMFSL